MADRDNPWESRVDDLVPGHRYRYWWTTTDPWLPIATAPIDTDILVCDSECYAPEAVRLTGDPAKPVYNHATGNYSRRLWPTHWMPMPQPPEKET